MRGFAVIDVETTGFYRTDRIVEVAVVLLDDSLRVEHEWATLINPHRHVSASEIHGITASDVAGAPDLPLVAPHLAALLDRRIIVAHNAPFDLRMLAAALVATAVHAPAELVTVDTLRLARTCLGGPASLPVVAEYLSIDVPTHHDALSDARVTADILARLLHQHDGHVPTGASRRTFSVESVAHTDVLDGAAVHDLLDLASQCAWSGCVMADPAPCHTRASATAARQDRDGYLTRLLWSLPGSAGLADPALDHYLLLLEHALADRLVTLDEAESLADLAAAEHLSMSQVMDAHRAFLAGLATAALADGVVTKAERCDLDAVARMLGLTPDHVTGALEAAHTVDLALSTARQPSMFAPGDRIVFTGEASVPRSVLEDTARSAGLTVTSSVSKRTRALVIADPLSESTKARTARGLGVDIVAEQVFLTACRNLREALDPV